MKKSLIPIIILACLSPTVARGQAGLFWDNSEQTRSTAGNGWDSGNRGTSALGQLESIAGRQVDTSRVPDANQPQQVAQPQVVHKHHSLSAGQQLGVSLFGAMLENVLFSSPADNSAAQAQALEQQRIAAELKRQQELQKARILHNQWRAEWDKRDNATTEQLAGVFDAASSTTGKANNFFGIPGGVDPKSFLTDVDLYANDPSVVDLRGAKTLTVSPVPTSLPLGRFDYKQTNDNRLGAGYSGDEALASEQADEWKMAKSYARWTWDKYKDEAESEVEEFLLDQVPGYSKIMSKLGSLPGVSQYQRYQKYKKFYDDKRNLLTGYNERILALAAEGSQSLVQGRPDYEAYFEKLKSLSDQGQETFSEKALDEIVSKIKK